jgi:endonuclease/exonuclease/phosphatase family metal-dependent hydrolase
MRNAHKRSTRTGLAFRLARSVAAVAVLLLSTAPARVSAQEATPVRERTLTVMTRNVYFGADFSTAMAASTVPDFLTAVGAVNDQLNQTSFPQRAAVLAHEIALLKPDFVGLQEVFTVHTQSLLDPTQSTTTDYLNLLLTDLAASGLNYEPVSIAPALDIKTPGYWPPTLTLEASDRNVILERVDAGTADLQVSNPRSGVFASTFTVAVPGGGTVPFQRSWASVDVSMQGRILRVVTTHLEAFSTPIQEQQVLELLVQVANIPYPIMLLGDFNSDADATPSPTTYALFRHAGFSDTWSQVYPGRSGVPGPTCCHAPNLLGGLIPPLTQRVDLVLAREGLRGVAASLVGNTLDDRTPGGLWPSDHAGVVVSLRPS